MKTAEEILSAPDAESLFGTPGDVDVIVRSLLKTWHPDVCRDPRASEVTSKINVLTDEAHLKIKNGTWSSREAMSWTGSDGKVRRFKYKKRDRFELGEYFYGSGHLIYEIEPGHRKRLDNGISRLSMLHYADDRMKREMSRFMPEIKSVFTTRTKSKVLVMQKPPGTYTLGDVVTSYHGRIPGVHAAWITSALLNICCFLEWNRISHGDISMSSVFITPSDHALSLLGGWWYASPMGDKIDQLPYRTARLAPADSIAMKVSDPRTDLLCTRALIRECLGDGTGYDLGSDVPGPMREFLTFPSSGSALEDYTLWRNEVLPRSFPKKFVEMDITDQDVFDEV